MAPRPPVMMSPIPVDPPGAMVSPMILQAQISPPVGGGSFGLADTTRLENPFQAPMWIDEIRFRLPVTGVSDQGQAWGNLRVELKLGNLSLTNGFVPISLLGKALNDSRQSVGAGGEIGVSTIYGNVNRFTWKLPKPLFIPARELLRPTIYYEPFPGAPVQTVTIIYVCRPLPKEFQTPKNLQVPWVTYFKPPSLTVPGAADAVDQSTNSDLFNPWDQELNVQRFMGRLMPTADTGSAAGGEARLRMTLASANVNPVTGLPVAGTFVSAQDSMNNILIRDPTPFAHVFDFLDRSWMVNCRLPPKGFYLFTVDRLWSGYNPSGGLTIAATVGISMIGWRTVRFYE